MSHSDGMAEIIGRLTRLKSLNACCAGLSRGDDEDEDEDEMLIPESWAGLINLRSFGTNGSSLSCLPEQVITAWSEHVKGFHFSMRQGQDVKHQLDKIFSTWNQLESIEFTQFPADDDDDADMGADVDDLYPWSTRWLPPRLRKARLCGVKFPIHQLPPTLEYLSLMSVLIRVPSSTTVEFPNLKTFSISQFVLKPQDQMTVTQGAGIATPALEKIFIGRTCCDPCRGALRDLLGFSDADRNTPKLREIATISQDIQLESKRRKIGGLLALNRCRERSGLDFSSKISNTSNVDDSDGRRLFGNERNTPLSLWPHAIENCHRLFRPSAAWPLESDCEIAGNVTFDRLQDEFKEEDGIFLFLRKHFEMANRHK
jgi:hypothetical protein